MIDRFGSRSEFERLRRSGARIRTSSLRCTFLHDPGVDPARVAFAVPRSAGTAVRRNLFRRRVRAILRHIQCPPGWWLISAHRPALELTFDELEAELLRLLDRARRAPSPVVSVSPVSPDHSEGSSV